jgi:hypothetical protein
MVSKTLERHWTFDTRPADDPVWSTAVVGGATVSRVQDHWQLDLTTTNEAQQARVDMAGNLMLDVTRLRLLTMLVEFSAIPSGVNAYWGLAVANQSAVNDITARVLFQSLGNNDIIVRCDDGVIDTGNLSSGRSILPNEPMEFTIDFANGLDTAAPAHLSKSRKDALRFAISRGQGTTTNLPLRGIGLTNYALGLQPFFRVDKASGTAEATIKLIEVWAEYLA